MCNSVTIDPITNMQRQFFSGPVPPSASEEGGDRELVSGGVERSETVAEKKLPLRFPYRVAKRLRRKGSILSDYAASPAHVNGGRTLRSRKFSVFHAR